MRVQGYLHNDWFWQNEPVGAIRGREIQLLHHTRYGIVDHIKGMPRRVRLVNVLAELDEPGEWYLDRRLKIYGNLFYRAGRCAGQFAGPANELLNNIALDMPVFWWTQKRPTDPVGIQKCWDDLSRFGRDLPQGDKGDFIYIMERRIGEKGWIRSPWKDEFPEIKRFIEINPFAQTFCKVDLNYAYNVREPFHIHGGDGTVKGMESKQTGRFRDLPREGVFNYPKPITLSVFRDIKSLDLRFKPGFKPMPGFRPIPFERIGLVRTEFRPNPPDKASYRRAVYNKFKDDKGGRYIPELVNARYPTPAYLH